MVGEVGVEPTMLPIRTRFTVWGCTRHSINSPVLLAEDKGIEVIILFYFYHHIIIIAQILE